MAILLRTLAAECAVSNTARTGELAQFWTQTLHNRGAWSRLAGLRQDLAQKSRADLQELCPALADEAQLEHLASAGLVEVRFANEDSSAGSSSWGIPWEFLLSAATEKKRNRAQRLLVFRHLASGTPGRNPFVEPANFLVIKNNPGFLGDLYTDNTFLREERNVGAHLKLGALPSLHNDHLASIRKHIKQHDPAIIHIAGVDLEQAAKFNPAVSGRGQEALMLEGPQGGVSAATAEELAPAICDGEEKPVLVSLSFVNSASQIAPSIIRGGAGAVVAFFNDFDDIVAETFFANFYLG